MINVDPWDMVNNFCFHVYAQKFIGENDNAFLGDIEELIGHD